MGFLNLPLHPFQLFSNSVMLHQPSECKYRNTHIHTHYVTAFPIPLVPFSWIRAGVSSSHPQVLFFLHWRKHHRACLGDHESPITGSNRVIAIVGSDVFKCIKRKKNPMFRSMFLWENVGLGVSSAAFHSCATSLFYLNTFLFCRLIISQSDEYNKHKPLFRH